MTKGWIAYKLTDIDMQTYGGFQWRLDEPAYTSGEGELCGRGWLHFYDDPLLAVFLNPIHARFKNPRMFEALATGEIKTDRGRKFGTTELTLKREIEVPVVMTVQRIAFGILCAKHVCDDQPWNAWADKWFSGEDRTMGAAKTTARRMAAMIASRAAREAAEAAATWSASEAAWAAWATVETTMMVINLKTIAKQAMEY